MTTETTPENATVAQNAVIEDALPLRELTLIGIMHSAESARALIRTAGGDIATVTTGDTVGRKTVAAISDESLILAAPNGSQTVLQMPS